MRLKAFVQASFRDDDKPSNFILKMETGSEVAFFVPVCNVHPDWSLYDGTLPAILYGIFGAFPMVRWLGCERLLASWNRSGPIA